MEGTATGRFLLMATSAVLLAGSFPPHDLWFVAWFGLTPLFLALRRAGPGESALLGFLFGSLVIIGSLSWVLDIRDVDLLQFALMGVLLALYGLIFGATYTVLHRRVSRLMIVAAPALWVALEYARANFFFLAWPWNLLGHSQYSILPIMQMADLTGVYGVSFLIVMVNQALSEAASRALRSRKAAGSGVAPPAEQAVWGPSLIAATLGVALALGYGGWRLAEEDAARTLRVAIIQGNRVPTDDLPAREQLQYLALYRQLSLEAARDQPALIVWPASSLPAPITSRITGRALRQFAAETDAYLLVGGAGHEKDRPRREGDLPYSNSEFLVSPAGRIEGQYNKIRLLPFNEYLPLAGVIPWPRWITTLRASFIPGAEYTLFKISGTAFGAPICWENQFPDLFSQFVREGAEFMVSVTNEGFFGHGRGGAYQTLAMNVFRAVENRVAVVRAATTGVSAFIDPNGAIAAKVQNTGGQDLFVAGYLVREVPLSSRKTFYTRYGDVFAISAAVLALFMSAFALLQRRFRLPAR